MPYFATACSGLQSILTLPKIDVRQKRSHFSLNA
jgi:hypothetical protein